MEDSFVALVKAGVIFKNRKRFGKLIKSFHEGYYKIDETKVEEKGVQSLANILEQIRFQMTVYGASIQVSLISGLISSLILRFTRSSGNWTLPYFEVSAVDITSSPGYEIGCVIQVVGACVIGLWTYVGDCTVISIIAEIVGHLKILEHHIRNFKNKGMQMNSVVEGNFPRSRLSSLIEYHLSILKTVNEVEHLCTYIILCLFLTGIILLCSVMYNTSTTPIGSIEFVRYLAYGIMGVVPIFMYCWYGNEITLANDALALSIFDKYNPEDSTNSNKALQMMLVKSQQPLFLTAAKFAPLSLDTFKGILKGSYSYFTVLRQVNIKQST